MRKKSRTLLIKWIRNTFLTEGLSLFLLACFAEFAGGSCIYIHTVFEGLLANACIHLGLMATSRFESRYFLLNAALDVALTTAVILGFGFLFGWFASTPPFVLVILVFLVYLACFVFQICRTQAELRYINEKLQKRQ